jgi:hypothetical protein
MPYAARPMGSAKWKMDKDTVFMHIYDRSTCLFGRHKVEGSEGKVSSQ